MSGLTSRWSFMNWFRGDDASQDAKQEGGTATLEAAGGDGDNGEHDGERDEGTRALTAREPGDRRDQAVEQLRGAYEEVVGLMNTIQDHMAAQSDRSERLLQMMSGLPEALSTLPASQRQQARTLEAIQSHLAQQTKNTQGLTQAIQGLAQAADNHDRSMSLIQQQLDAHQASSQQVLSSFDTLSQTLGRMGESSQAGTQVLERLATRSEQGDAQMRELFGRNQRQMTVMSVVSWALAIAALSVASMVAIWVGQQMTGNDGLVTTGPAETTPVSPTTTAAAGVTTGGASTVSEGVTEPAVREAGLAAPATDVGDTARPTSEPVASATLIALPGTLTLQQLIGEDLFTPALPASTPGEASDHSDDG